MKIPANRPDFAKPLGTTPAKTAAKPKRKPKDWTCLFYLAADDQMDIFLPENLKDLEKVGSGPRINLAAQLTTRAPGEVFGKKLESKRYLIEKSKNPKAITSPALEQETRTQINDPKHLERFLSWGMKTYPAKNYLIVIGSHGGGVAGAIRKSEEEGDDQFISLPQISLAVQNAEKAAGVDKEQVVLGFDACHMAQAEAAVEFQDTAGLLIASQDSINGEGWPYSDFLGKAGIENLTPEKMSQEIIQAGTRHPGDIRTLAALDMKQALALKKALDKLGEIILKDKYELREIKKAFHDAPKFDSEAPEIEFSFRDLGAVADNLADPKRINFIELNKAAREVKTALNKIVKAETHRSDIPQASGLSIYPGVGPKDAERYQLGSLKINRNSPWMKALRRISR